MQEEVKTKEKHKKENKSDKLIIEIEQKMKYLTCLSMMEKKLLKNF